MKKDRTPEVHFYEWSVPRWVLSSTHDKLDASGRGIYRELLDLCYTQGGFPFDIPLICRKCACTAEQFEAAWIEIERHFPKDSHRPSMRINRDANTYRKNYFGYVAKQRKNRKGTHPEGGTRKPVESTDNAVVVGENLTTVEKSSDGGFTQHNTTLHDVTQHDTTRDEGNVSTPPPPTRLPQTPVDPPRRASVSPRNGHRPGAMGDEPWQEFRRLGTQYGWKYSDVEWDEARQYGWSPLDFTQQLTAVAHIRALIEAGDSGLVRAHPKNYLAKGMYIRSIGPPPKTSAVPSKTAWLERIANGEEA